MKFCPECGKVWNGSNFCAECGKDLRNYINGGSEFEQAPVVKEEMSFSANFDFLSELDNLTDASEQASTVSNDIAIERSLSNFETKKLSNGKYMITALKNTSDLFVNIPDSVQIIDEEVFENYGVIEVTLPEGLIKIGRRAFASCRDLEKINFPTSLRIIDDEAFYDCENLKVSPPQNVRIGKNAFGHSCSTDPQIIAWRTHGIELYNQEHYEEAIQVLKKAAEAEDAEAQAYLGDSYLDAQYEESEAIYWYKKAVEKGNSHGLCALAYCYQIGMGVEADDSQARHLYVKAAEKGNSDAFLDVARYYELDGDLDKALYWAEKASLHKDATISNDAKYWISDYYLDKEDFNNAISYLNKVSKDDSFGIEKIKKIEELRKLKEEYSKCGDIEILYKVGLSFYSLGSYENAFLYLSKVEHKYISAAFFIAEIYYLHKKNYEEALKRYRQVTIINDIEVSNLRQIAETRIEHIEKNSKK